MSLIALINKKYTIVALDMETSKEFIDTIKDLDAKEQQKALNAYVSSNSISGDDLKDLMYDLGKAGYRGLKKPEGGGAGAGGDLLSLAHNEKWEELSQVIMTEAVKKQLTEFFKKNPAKFGKFITAASKNGLGVYERNFHVPITKNVLEHVSDDYIVDSILYASLYGTKILPADAIDYAFDRITNPLKVLSDKYDPAHAATLIEMGYDKSSGFGDKLDKWFKALPKQDQEKVRSNYDATNTSSARELPA